MFSGRPGSVQDLHLVPGGGAFAMGSGSGSGAVEIESAESAEPSLDESLLENVLVCDSSWIC